VWVSGPRSTPVPSSPKLPITGGSMTALRLVMAARHSAELDPAGTAPIRLTPCPVRLTP
jgi:hypothetical protein